MEDRGNRSLTTSDGGVYNNHGLEDYDDVRNGDDGSDGNVFNGNDDDESNGNVRNGNDEEAPNNGASGNEVQGAF
jgi:hypothetical protein